MASHFLAGRLLSASFLDPHFSRASTENLPGPNTTTIRALSRNGNGSAFTNLSESLKMPDTASKSAVRKETIIEDRTRRAKGRETKRMTKTNLTKYLSALM